MLLLFALGFLLTPYNCFAGQSTSECNAWVTHRNDGIGHGKRCARTNNVQNKNTTPSLLPPSPLRLHVGLCFQPEWGEDNARGSTHTLAGSVLLRMQVLFHPRALRRGR